MVVKRNEAWLRSWLRSGWDDVERGPLCWIEPGRGSTVGVPDCLLPVGGLWIPIELKASKNTHAHYKFKSRPAQYRFHQLAARSGHLSCYLVVCSDDIIVYPFVEQLKESCLVTGSSVISVEHLVKTLSSDKFWGTQPVRRLR